MNQIVAAVRPHASTAASSNKQQGRILLAGIAAIGQPRVAGIDDGRRQVLATSTDTGGDLGPVESRRPQIDDSISDRLLKKVPSLLPPLLTNLRCVDAPQMNSDDTLGTLDLQGIAVNDLDCWAPVLAAVGDTGRKTQNECHAQLYE